jgi:hypothetical protein
METNRQPVYLGFDPVGRGKFGVAAVYGDRVKALTVGTVDEAMTWAVDACGSRPPVAAGIDTLLHWATSEGGMRPCDKWLRKKYPDMKKSIMSPNSLYGAMAVVGMALALRLRQTWPNIALNETHPKVLLSVWDRGYDPKDRSTIDAAIQWLVGQNRYIEPEIAGEHQLDAAVSAWCTQRGLEDDWMDIIGSSDGLLFPVGEVRLRYLWPQRSAEPLK